MKRSMILAVLALGALAFAASGAAHPKPDHAKKGTFAIKHSAQDPTRGHGPPVHPRSDAYGPYTVTSTDNGCSGTPWASDTLTRTFVVKRAKGTKSADGTTTSPNWRIWRYDRGTFTTTAGTSPGNCASNTSPHGTTVSAGKTGKVHGYLAGVVTGGTYNPGATCTGDTCGSTDVFIATHFGSSAQFTCFTDSTQCKFDFEYTAPGQHLAYHHWSDKGTGAGSSLNETFAGDIADASTTD